MGKTHIQHIPHIQRRIDGLGFPLNEGAQHANSGTMYVPTEERDSHVLSVCDSLKIPDQPISLILYWKKLTDLALDVAGQIDLAL